MMAFKGTALAHRLDLPDFVAALGAWYGEALSRSGGGEGGSSRSDLLERNPGLLAQRGKVEVDPLAGHQPLPEWHDVGEGHGERSPARRNPEPVSTAGSPQCPPHDDHVVAESHAFVFRSQVRE